MYPGDIEKRLILEHAQAPLRALELERRRACKDASIAMSPGRVHFDRLPVAGRLSAFLRTRMSRSTTSTAWPTGAADRSEAHQQADSALPA